MYSIKINENVYDIFERSTRKNFASDYLYKAAVEKSGLAAVSISEILDGENVDTYYLPVIDLENKLFTIGEFDGSQKIIPSDFVFVDKNVLQQILKEIDPIILAMYFDLNSEQLAEFRISDDIIDNKEEEYEQPTLTSLKPVTYDVVKEKTLKLIDENGSTTSLDVKLALRNEFYNVTQDEASSWLKEVARKENLDFNAVVTNGHPHLVYTR
jgi:hypothetical protein